MTVDRVARVLADMTDTAGDPEAREIPVAATVVIARDTAAGPEVFMIERPDRGSFAGAWVFPGGKIESQDAGAGEEERARSAGVRETHEETGLTLTRDALQPFSRWVPPTSVTLRIRTWFFVAPDPGGEPVLAADEAVRAEWMRPADALERHGRGELTLYPPTWVTLHDLAGQDTVADIVAAARLSGVREFETVARKGAAGAVLLWQGDGEYDAVADPADATAPERHRLDMSALPWVYTRS
ncbi:NUDIX hydrolase [Microbacterium sp. MC2]